MFCSFFLFVIYSKACLCFKDCFHYLYWNTNDILILQSILNTNKALVCYFNLSSAVPLIVDHGKLEGSIWFVMSFTLCSHLASIELKVTFRTNSRISKSKKLLASSNFKHARLVRWTFMPYNLHIVPPFRVGWLTVNIIMLMSLTHMLKTVFDCIAAKPSTSSYINILMFSYSKFHCLCSSFWLSMSTGNVELNSPKISTSSHSRFGEQH